MVKFLLIKFENTPVYIALTTYVENNKERAERVIVRNQIAKEIADRYDLVVIDLYTVSLEIADLLSTDGVHFVSEGYERLAEEIIRVISK